MLCGYRSIGTPIELGIALETVIRLSSRKQGVAIDTDLLLRDYVLLFFVQSLSREEGVFVDVICDLGKYRLCELFNEL